MKKFKNWNWTAFVVIVTVCCIGALGNKSLTSIKDVVILTSVFGVPIGLFFAWMTKEEI
jgi:hypothetical protein